MSVVTMMKTSVVSFFVVGLFCLIPFVVRAGEFHLDTSILGQVRENEQSQSELPISGYLGLATRLPKSHVSMETNMRLFRDFERNWDDYDLYQAVLHWSPS